MDVFFIIPAYNEAERIAPILETVKKTNYPFIVIDDGSTDSTADTARRYGKVIVHPKNKGKGAALQTGIAHLPECEYVAIMDADGEKKIQDYLRAFKVIDKSDCLIGRRDISRSSERRMLNLFGAWWIRTATGYMLADPFSGFIIIRKDLLERLRITANGFEIELNLLLECFAHGANVKEVLISHHPTKKTHLKRNDYRNITCFFDDWILQHLDMYQGWKRYFLSLSVSLGHKLCDCRRFSQTGRSR
ncbi:glycosyltransferase family 2 protein [Candidatus Woesearchaeota archaeon]|nr:glycosyltransferase family 2 protein [Candidatus Woesearchaeota archaeon]